MSENTPKKHFFKEISLKDQVQKRLTKLRTVFWQNPLRTSLIFLSFVWISVATLVLFSEKAAQGHNIESFEDALWWGLVTLSTVGYGDKYPVTTSGRFAAALLIISGLIGIAIVTAKISSYFLERALRERRGVVDSDTLKDHFIICGWKDEMSDFLMHFLDGNPNVKASDVVLVTNAPESDLDHIHEIERLKKIRVIHGEHYLEVNLQRAAPDRATKILILADATPGPDGSIPTITEADARTIMTAMALNNIARGVPVVAELLDASMDRYLRMAHVNEIIHSRDQSRLLLALSSGGVGIINVFQNLLSARSASFMATRKVPEGFAGRTYKELQLSLIEAGSKDTLIGVLENSGNAFAAKEAALKRAQQTPNIAELVQNLQAVKALRFNNPILNPDPEYKIQETTMLIMIEDRGAQLHGKQ